MLSGWHNSRPNSTPKIVYVELEALAIGLQTSNLRTYFTFKQRQVQKIHWERTLIGNLRNLDILWGQEHHLHRVTVQGNLPSVELVPYSPTWNAALRMHPPASVLRAFTGWTRDREALSKQTQKRKTIKKKDTDIMQFLDFLYCTPHPPLRFLPRRLLRLAVFIQCRTGE